AAPWPRLWGPFVLVDAILTPTREPSLLSSQVQQGPGHPLEPDLVPTVLLKDPDAADADLLQDVVRLELLTTESVLVSREERSEWSARTERVEEPHEAGAGARSVGRSELSRSPMRSTLRSAGG